MEKTNTIYKRNETRGNMDNKELGYQVTLGTRVLRYLGA